MEKFPFYNKTVTHGELWHKYTLMEDTHKLTDTDMQNSNRYRKKYIHMYIITDVYKSISPLNRTIIDTFT